jgi:hypothetical protein
METTFDLSFTYGLIALLLAVGVAGVVALPWRAVTASDSLRAWEDLSRLSGGFARSRAVAVSRLAGRLVEVASRRPAADAARSLS